MFTSYQKNITVILLAFSLFFLAFACKKDKEATPAVEEEVTISILSPEKNAIVTGSQPLRIHVSIKSPVTLHGYTWKLTNKADGSILTEQESHTHDKELTIDETWDWATHIREETAAVLEVIVTIDHDGKTAQKSVDITFRP